MFVCVVRSLYIDRKCVEFVVILGKFLDFLFDLYRFRVRSQNTYNVLYYGPLNLVLV